MTHQRPSVTVIADEPARQPVAPVISSDLITRPVPGDTRFRGRRLIVLYFDLYQMQFFEQMRTLENADRYVSTKMTAADLVAVMVFDGRGVRLKQNFTDDRPTLHSAIQALMTAAEERDSSGVEFDPGGAFGEDDDTFSIFATDRQLSALQTAVTDLGPLPEVKTLVYFGSGLRLNGTDNLAQMRATVNAAVRSNVTLNPVDARGLVASAPIGDATRASPAGIGMFDGTIAASAITRGQQSQDTLYALAKDTGGRAMFDNNDLALGIARAAQAVTGYYILGYYTKNIAKDGRYRRVNVTLAAGTPGQLSHRSGWALRGDKEFGKFNHADKERQLAEALKLEDPITDIPMAAEVNYFQINRAEYFVPVSVRMPGSELAPAVAGGASHVDIDMIGEIKDTHDVTYRNVRDVHSLPHAHARQATRQERRVEPADSVPRDRVYTMLLLARYVIKLLARNDSTTGRDRQRSSVVVHHSESRTRRTPHAVAAEQRRAHEPTRGGRRGSLHGETEGCGRSRQPARHRWPETDSGGRPPPSGRSTPLRLARGLRARRASDATRRVVRHVLSRRCEGVRDRRAGRLTRPGTRKRRRCRSASRSQPMPSRPAPTSVR